MYLNVLSRVELYVRIYVWYKKLTVNPKKVKYVFNIFVQILYILKKCASNQKKTITIQFNSAVRKGVIRTDVREITLKGGCQ